MDLAQDPYERTDRLQHALGVAYSYLNRRERTVSEVERRLVDAGIDDATASTVIATLHDQGYVDDARFALLFAQDKRELEQWGRERIERGLAARGISGELIRETLGGDHESEFDRALSLLRRRFPMAPQSRRDRDRALGVLLRKGYGSELALDVLAAHTRSAEAA
jgi:regulatory protein